MKAQTEQSEILRTDLKSTRERLDVALAEARSKQHAIDELQQAKINAESQLATQKAAVDQLRAELDRSHADLTDIKTKACTFRG